MIRRRRNVPWIQRQSRFIIGAIAVIGFILTAYLTMTSLTGQDVACTADAASSGCGGVLNSAYAYPLDPVGKTGPPLSLFGSLAYLAMIVFALSPLFVNPDQDKKLRQKLDDWQCLNHSDFVHYWDLNLMRSANRSNHFWSNA